MNMLDEAFLLKVEWCVCDYFKVDYNETLVERLQKRECANARHFIYCILHDSYGFSIRELAKHYHVNERWMKRSNAKIRSHCRIYKECKKHYDVITTVLLDLDFA